MSTSARDVLDSFLAKGAIFEGNRGKFSALAAMAVVGAVVVLTPASIAAPDGISDILESLQAGAAPAGYPEMIQRLQAEVSGMPGGHNIVVVDRSADFYPEVERVAHLSGLSSTRVESLMEMGDAFSDETVGDVCIVAGDRIDFTAAQSLTEPGLKPVHLGDVSDLAFQQWTLDQMIAKCFPGVDSGNAAAYAAYRAFANGQSNDIIPVMTASTELQAWNGMMRPSVTAALRHAQALLDQEEFAASVTAQGTTPEQLLSLASLDYGYSEDTNMRRVGQALGFALNKDAFYVPTQDGYVIADKQTWLQNATFIPEVSRILELQQFLSSTDPDRRLPGAFEIDMVTSQAEVARLAAAGDPTARAIASAYQVKSNFHLQPIETDQYLPSNADVAGVPIEFDRTIPTVVKFEKLGHGIEILDAELRTLISADSNGIVTVYPANAEREGDAKLTASL